jgi:hypothetical protein
MDRPFGISYLRLWYYETATKSTLPSTGAGIPLGHGQPGATHHNSAAVGTSPDSERYAQMLAPNSRQRRHHHHELADVVVVGPFRIGRPEEKASCACRHHELLNRAASCSDQTVANEKWLLK